MKKYLIIAVLSLGCVAAPRVANKDKPDKPVEKQEGVYNIEADQSKSLLEVVDAGHFSDVDERIKKSQLPFSLPKGVEKADVMFVNSPLSDPVSESLDNILDKHHLRPITLEELALLWAQHSAELGQGDLVIIAAFGSSWVDLEDNVKYVPCVIKEGKKKVSLSLACPYKLSVMGLLPVIHQPKPEEKK